IGEGTADKDGNFVLPLTPAAAHDMELSVTATDAAGNVSDPTVVTVDSVPPTTPIVDPTDGSEVTGQTEPGAQVVVKDKEGNIIGEGEADKDGNFVIPISPIPDDGDKITVEVTDPAGNTSEPTEVVVDSTAPDAPVVNPTNGTQVSGQAEAGSVVTVKDTTGKVLGSGTADAEGNFEFSLSPAADHGATLSVTATDPAGNVSDPTVVTVDSVPPTTPIVDPTDGSEVTGQTEPGAQVVVKDKEGNIIGEGEADKDGNFVIPISPIPDDGDKITVEVTDPAGNTSEPTEVVVDSTAPDAPVVNPTNGTQVSGQAEAGSVVTVKDTTGKVLGSGTADAEGNFEFSLSPAAPEGAELTVTATDPAGNVSDPTTRPMARRCRVRLRPVRL
ncbi:Ig-like domain-containing protein, partial [Leucobacter luti]|uniref:Ig-like domain-containing protein n=1 Tax=Leucobacter luti TaxID=340320 RepID=UPI0019263A11